ncbi:phage baseplate assembly protein V [Chitinimonas arctica]|uniref:Phage baseplate assembly protein V n=2 Tax=Chitinimonas arctica TaxID=2594795 RepID=A0A516S9U8_9NEIS|nr:phage baseplate assembly protein V [Chitinimonas arctica]
MTGEKARMSDNYAINEIDRRLAVLLAAGTIEEVRHSPPARARVRIGGWVSAWLPWTSFAAGQVRRWRPPSKGEQVLMLNPSGLPEGGFILPGFNTNQHAQPDQRPHATVEQMPDGAKVEYDWQAHQYLVEAPPNGRIVLRVGATELELRSDGVTLRTPKFEGVQA